MNEVMTQAAPVFEAAWSQETEPLADKETRGHSTTAMLAIFVGLLLVITFWLVVKLVIVPNAVAAQSITQSPAPVPEVAIPTLTIPDVPNAGAIDQDTRYVNLLSARGVQVPDKAAGAESAHDMCQAKHDGHTTAELISAVLQANPKLATGLAPVVVKTAIETYCP